MIMNFQIILPNIYVKDLHNFFNDMNTNTGFVRRMDCFSQLDGRTRKWKDDSVLFVGKFASDLDSNQAGILNGVSCRIEFQLAQSAFFLMAEAGLDIKFEVEEMTLSIPTAVLSSDVFLKIERNLKSKDAVINFRRREVLPQTIPQNTIVWHSDTLFPLNNLPCRIVLGFLSTSARLGNLQQNPYEFKRTFGNCSISQVNLTLNVRYLKSKFNNI
jgi:hypothetical protein